MNKCTCGGTPFYNKPYLVNPKTGEVKEKYCVKCPNCGRHTKDCTTQARAEWEWSKGLIFGGN